MRRSLAAVAFLAIWLFAIPASAQCGVYKTYGLKEVLLNPDLNASFTRTVTANIATCVTGYSASVAQMRSVTDPYPSSTESLASTVADELARVRFQLQAAVGKNYWYEPVDISLAKNVPKHIGATYLEGTKIADPPIPGAKDARLYFKDDGAGVTVLAYRDSAGTVNTLTGASTSYGNSVTTNYLAKRNAGTPNTKLDLSADRISVEGFIKTSFTATIDATTTGPNAMDAGALAANAIYYTWIIVNPTTLTFAGLLSTSETAPTMPAGYTKKRLVGAFATNASSQFIDGVQKGREFTYATPTDFGFVGGQAATGAAVVAITWACVRVPNKSTQAITLALQDVNAGGGGARSTLIHWQTFTPATTTPGSVTTAMNAPYVRANYSAFQSMSPARIPMNNATDTCTLYVQQIFDQINISVVGFEMVWKD